MELKQLLVVIPHSGVLIPSEIPLENLSDQFPILLQNVDWYTNWLYDFRDLLENRQIVFPYCSLILDANRHPDIISDSVPLNDVRGEPIYKTDMASNDSLRKELAKKYLMPFNKAIEECIESGIEFLLDGHSTVKAHGVADNQIDLMNFQHSYLDKNPLYYSPDLYVEAYATELRKRLPDIKVTVNSSEYYTVYGHVCAEHSTNSIGRVGKRIPAIIQETCHRLYMNSDQTPNVSAINRLRRIFAESIHAAYYGVRGNKLDE